MGRDRSRVLVLALGYVAAVVPALFVIEWFYIDLGIDSLRIGLRDGRGMFGALAIFVFWGSILLMIPAVGFQTFTRITSGVANAKLSRYGVFVGLALLASGLAAAYVFAPEVPGPAELVPEVQRSVAPLLFAIANVLGIAALHYAALETTDDDAGTYKPVVIDRPITRPPITTQPPITRPATQPPINRPATQPPKTKSNPPISALLPKTKSQPPASALQPVVARAPTQPPTLKRKLNYLVLSGEVTRAGIDARREDGSSLLLLWRDVVGVVVRRLPDELDATTFMDIVSVKGSTLRIVPWTRLTGISVVGAGDGRLRSLASYVATMCSDVQLFDPATKIFLEKAEPAAQLKDVAKLAAHDERLS